MESLTRSGSLESVSDGRVTRIWISYNWAGEIKCAGPIILTRARRDRGWLTSLFEWMRKVRREKDQQR